MAKGENVYVFKTSEEELLDSISGLSQAKELFQGILIKTNIEGKGVEAAKELGEHIDTAISAMYILLDMLTPVKSAMSFNF